MARASAQFLKLGQYGKYSRYALKTKHRPAVLANHRLQKKLIRSKGRKPVGERQGHVSQKSGPWQEWRWRDRVDLGTGVPRRGRAVHPELGGHARVLEPKELAEQLKAAAQAILGNPETFALNHPIPAAHFFERVNIGLWAKTSGSSRPLHTSPRPTDALPRVPVR